jgi:hypothetical protein
MLTKEQKLTEYYRQVKKTKVLYWAEKHFNWRPRHEIDENGQDVPGGRKAWFQAILLGCLEGIYKYPADYHEEKLRNKTINKFCWRIGRQSGKTECLALAVLYLSLCKPIRYNEPMRRKFPNLVGKEGPDDKGWRRVDNWKIKGSKMIMASRDAPSAKIVFDRVLQFIDRSPVYKAALDEGLIEVKLNPFPMLTFNVPGWTSPATVLFRGPGANGQAARGFTFDYKLYDEADYMPNTFFEAELATSINAGQNALTILSSTPTGKRDYFHAACFDENAPVSMADGTLKPISEVQTGDMVFNRYGVSEKVTDTFKRPYKGKMVSFTTTLNNTIITGTGNHKIMAVHKRNRFCKSCEEMVWKNRTVCIVHGRHKGLPDLKPDYIMLRDLVVGDFIAIPKNLVNPNEIKYCAVVDDFVYVAIDDIHSEMVESKPVYNLEVGEDHSYCVNNYGVANCTNPQYHFEEFHFPSFENPNYTPELDASFRVQLTAAGYEHEILADWGITEYGVFNWTHFERVFSYKYQEGETKNKIYVPGEYECIKLSATDLGKIGLPNLIRFLRAKMPPRKDNCTYYFGADLGYKNDPSEMVIFEQFNGVMKLILRINLQNVTYEIQGDMIAFLDRTYMFDALGMDEGGNGLSLKQMLQTANVFDKTGYNKYAQHRFDMRLHAINFGQKMILGKQFGKDQSVPAKQWMTDLIVKQAEDKLLYLPNLDYDKEVENQFRNHTYSLSSNGTVIYSKSDIYPDHIVDAIRTAFYARQHTFLPKARKWSVGSTFRSNGSGGWR